MLLKKYTPLLITIFGAISTPTYALHNLPGTIQAEEYNGAYDTTPENFGGEFRTDAVDIEATSDIGGGYNVGWTEPGEFLHYNVEIPTPGNYRITARIATIDDATSMHFKLDGFQLASIIPLPNTEGWQSWQDVAIETSLPSGSHILEAYFNTAGINLNYIQIEKIPDTNRVILPATLQAEDYHAFKDTTLGNTGGEYRSDDVDIEICDDDGGGFNVGWTALGESLSYSITVEEDQSFEIHARYSTPRNGRGLEYLLNGNPISDTQTLNNTEGWQSWDTIVTRVDIPTGAHELSVRFLNEEINLNYLDIIAIDDHTSEEWELVWSDEFDGDQLDPSRWEYEVNAWGGGNNELQYYTARPENSTVSDGFLTLRAHRENFTGSEGTREYTSARVRTKNKGDFLYGRIEARARLPFGQGIWPAIWMLPTDNVYGGWAASGEIDIVEAVNTGVANNNTIHGTIHYGGAWPNNTYTGSQFTPATSISENFHVYAIEWERNSIRWYVDDVLYQTQNDWRTEGHPYPAPFDQRFHIIMNVAVGGNWPGYPDGTTVFPQEMLIDYVRVYQKSESENTRLTIVNSGGGTITSDDGFIQCGTLCARDYNDSQTIVLTASAEQGYQFSGWPDGMCTNETESNCTISISPNEQDIVLNTAFDVVDTCNVSTPFGGSAPTIPSRIEAEAFDEGCEGVAYLDNDSNNEGGEFRDTAVDIELAEDIGGGYSLGWLRDGEWLNYTIHVDAPGSFDVVMRIASEGNGSRAYFTVENERVGQSVAIPNTGGWQSWRDVTLRGVYLEAGSTTLTLNIDDGDFNLNHMTFVPEGESPFNVDKSRGEWTLIVIPDTQHYSQNRPNAPIAHMRTAFDWVVSVVDSMNVKFVQGLGDITEDWDARWEWENSTSAWDKLYGEVPFMPIMGNHDVPYMLNEYFPVSSFSDEPWYGGDFGGIENNFALMRIGNEDYMFLHVEPYDQYSEYRPAGMAWAQRTLAEHPNRKVILATHDTWATDHIVNNLLTRYDNIVMSNAGHVCQREARYTTSGPQGGVSHNFITDYQCDAQEVMRIRYYIFKPLEDKVDYFTYSPILDEFEVDSSSQGSFPLYQVDP